MKRDIIFYRVRSYLKYLLKSRHRKGYGIHSPFVFYLVRELFGEEHPFYAFKKIDAAKRMLLKNNMTIGPETLGAPSVTGDKRQKVKHFVKQGSLPAKYGELIFRLVNYFGAKNILELGTGTGLSTLWLALPDSRARVTTIEGSRQLSDFARRLFELVEVNNVRIINDAFNRVLPSLLDTTDHLDFVFFDGDHRREATLHYFELCLKKAHNDTVFVFDDIHWSPDMEAAWETILQHPSITVSMDLYRIGIIFFRKECTRQHYVVRF
ncbi:O-methyltransferase [Thermophagus sp. OGC60D27]|uniref:O-methyltransferase n=1 Tax=Thermophagus sp. OGC60D27 TaxID=3458415 RepID=UPI00403811FC